MTDLPDPPLPGLLAQKLPDAYHAALAAKGQGYVPRTRHRQDDGAPRFTNRLILTTNPYLLQHAHNPVSWHAWGDPAFARAAEQGKLVVLSVGYSTCHWCHVMEHESFEDLEIASFMNERYVAIKVDREERPDVDAVYMAVTQMMTGSGGWPMTVIMTPEREPVFAGTYFPARDGERGARFGFLTLLRELDRRWREEPAMVREVGAEAVQRLARTTEVAAGEHVPGGHVIERGTQILLQIFDPKWGGFGGAPKFPRPVSLDLLARHSGANPRALAALTVTLDKMAAGGIHDQIGGGFHRYAVDSYWLVPHFEKMLYDQAQLVVAYLEGHQITGNVAYARVVRKTCDYVLSEMTSPEGGFYAATDADSPGAQGESVEGLFFTWTPAEIEAVVGAERARLVCAYFGVSEGGNFEGRSVLHVPEAVEGVARRLTMTPEALTAAIEEARPALYQARSGRPPPLRDDKLVTAWNGLMISALARAGFVLAEGRYVAAAERAAAFVLERARAGEDLARHITHGVVGPPGFLDDSVFMIQALVDLYEATGTLRWLEQAMALQARIDRDLWDEAQGGYFFTGSSPDLLVRDKPDYDGAEPAGNSVAALNLLRLAELVDRGEFRSRAERIFAAFARPLHAGMALPKMLGALDFYRSRPLEIVLVRPQAAADWAPLVDPLRRIFLPNHVRVLAREGDRAHAAAVSLAAERPAIEGRVTAYVCRGRACELPTQDAQTLAEQLSAGP